MISLRFVVTDSSHAGEIRRKAAALAEQVGLAELPAANLAVIVNECCTNLIKHAGGGEILLNGCNGGVHLLAIDRGPGMSNVTDCLRDGYSSSGTTGTGLGAIKRMANCFDLFTHEGKGSVLYAGVTQPGSRAEVEIGVVNLPFPGEELSGDGWAWGRKAEGIYKVLLADGLGHGLLAHRAAETAVQAFPQLLDRAPAQTIEALHEALRATRGAAVAVAEVDYPRAKVNYAGLGNISGALLSPGSVRRLISFNGTAGLQARKIQPMSYPLEPNALLLMHSDGLVTSWDVTGYPGLLLRHPFVVAGLFYRDYSRGNDDLSVFVLRRSAA